MRQNQLHDDVKRDNAFDPMVADRDFVQPTAAVRLQARIFAAKFDRQIEAGVAPTPAGPLAVHIARLTSTRERENLARAVLRILNGGYNEQVAVAWRIPVSQRVNECHDMLEDIVLRLHSPRPVEPRGMARLRTLLSDGTGPLYMDGRGNLKGQVKAALEAL